MKKFVIKWVIALLICFVGKVLNEVIGESYLLGYVFGGVVMCYLWIWDVKYGVVKSM